MTHDFDLWCSLNLCVMLHPLRPLKVNMYVLCNNIAIIIVILYFIIDNQELSKLFFVIILSFIVYYTAQDTLEEYPALNSLHSIIPVDVAD